MLLKGLHHDPDEVQHTQQPAESRLAQDIMLLLLLKYTQVAAL